VRAVSQIAPHNSALLREPNAAETGAVVQPGITFSLLCHTTDTMAHANSMRLGKNGIIPAKQILNTFLS